MWSPLAGRFFCVALLSCAAAQRAPEKKDSLGWQKDVLRVRSFSETRTVTSIARAGGLLYVGTTRGLVVWDVARGEFESVGPGQLLPGWSVRAVAADTGGTVWVATDGGFAKYAGNTWRKVFAPPEAAEARCMVVVRGGREAWVAGERGIHIVGGALRHPVLPDAVVTNMLPADADSAWVGTRSQGVLRFDGQRWVSHFKQRGSRVEQVETMGHSSSGGLLVAGRDSTGLLLGYWDQKRWWHYRLRGGSTLRALGGFGNDDVIAVDREVYALAPRDKDEKPATLGLDGLESEAPLLKLRATGGTVPASVTTQFMDASEGPLFGTEWLGVLRADGRALRTRDVRGELEKLHVGCSQDRCYFVAGDERAVKFDGEKIWVTDIDSQASTRVLSFARDRQGNLYALHGLRGESVVRLSREYNGKFMPIAETKIRVPAGDPLVRFAEFSPGGKLWIGLAYRDLYREIRSYGVAVVDTAQGGVVYHGTRRELQDKADKSFRVPNDVRSVLFHNTDVWLATLEGAIRLRGKKARVYTENDGLDGEITMDMADWYTGEVWAATPAGVGRYDGRKWTFGDREEFGRARALHRSAAGVMYVGTSERGVVRLEGTSRRDITRKDGLLANSVLDVRVDALNRVWVMTTEGISIIEGSEPPIAPRQE